LKLKEVNKFMENLEVVSMATVDEDQPRVRIKALISHDKKFWC
jgi:uncharacterized pyridoxamine 5'-phosphate oxidase family protein